MTGDRFFEFLMSLFNLGVLSAGDILVLDNAPIHWPARLADATYSAFLARGAKIAFLPTYSPELNPCELIFSFVKSHVRRSNSGLSEGYPFIVRVAKAFADVSRPLVLGCYSKCIDHPDRA